MGGLTSDNKDQLPAQSASGNNGQPATQSSPATTQSTTVTTDPDKTAKDQNAVLNPLQSIPALLNPAQSMTNAFNYVGDLSKNYATAMTAQNGFQAYAPGIQQQNLAGPIAQQYGQLVGQQNNQNNLAGMIGNRAMGYGPNPAQTQFQANNNQIAAQQAGAIASQKGLNPALQARLISQQGGQQQQAGAGQAATLQAQQQIAAQQQLASLEGQQAQQALQAQQIFQNAQASQNTAVNQGSLGAQGINAQTAQANADAVNKTQGGLFGGLSAIAALFAKGGEVQPVNGPVSHAGKHLKGSYKKGGLVPGQAKVAGDNYKNDTVNAKLSPKEIVLPRSVTLSKNAPQEAAKFVAAVLKKNKRMKAV